MSLLLNPKFPATLQKKYGELYSKVPKLKNHVWLTSSGTLGKIRLIGLSVEGLEASASEVNRHLETTAKDRWLLCLPTFHVAGLGVKIRGEKSNSKVFETKSKWNPKTFHSFCEKNKITLASLVPTQVFDLVKTRCKSPKSVRAVLVGGSKLHRELKEAATQLGWPIRESYGMTETSSTIGIAPLQLTPSKIGPTQTLLSKRGSDFTLLAHLQAKVINGKLLFKGDSLLVGLIEEGGEFFDPKEKGWFFSDDLGEINGQSITLFGRSGDFIKIAGESCDLNWLQQQLIAARLEVGFCGDSVLRFKPDERHENQIYLEATEINKALVEAYDRRVPPYAKIHGIHLVTKITRSELGKAL